MRAALIVVLVCAAATATKGQVVITSEDLFNEVGQYYKAYAFKEPASLFAIPTTEVTGRLGTTGGPQLWDFTAGPENEIYRVDIVPTSDGGHAAVFSEAKFAERTTEETTGKVRWSFFAQVPGIGRLNYGHYDEASNELLNFTSPAHKLETPIVDFPDTIRFRDTWATSTSWKLEINEETGMETEDPELGGGNFIAPVTVKRSSVATVDAFGIANLPGIGFADALRVNEVVTLDVQIDLGEGAPSSFVSYLRNYYWLCEDRGIAVVITSESSSQGLPPENFNLATQFTRLFETNHAQGQSPVDLIRDFKISLRKDATGKVQAILSWAQLGSVNSYRVEFTDDLAGGTWTPLGTTTFNFLVDTTLTGASPRFYRLIGLRN